MKKYICPNCGFVGRMSTKKVQIEGKRHKHVCKKCNADVYNSKVVLQSELRMHILQQKHK